MEGRWRAAVRFVFFVYTCPSYSRRLSDHLDGIGITTVRWQPFVPAELVRDEPGPPVCG
jgi:hypothetical protein